MKLLLWTVCCSLLLAISHQIPPILITAPNIIHVGVEESIMVQTSEGAQNSITVTMHFLNQIANLKCTQDQTFILDKANGFIQKNSLKITPAEVQQCGIDKLRTKYVQLVARSNALPGGERQIPILLSTRKGYLFIQTDKSIYTPSQKALYRVFILDHMMRPSSESITVKVFNAQGIQVYNKEQVVKTSILNKEVIIPDISEPGTWRITAQFTSAPESNTSAEFEVRKYVLPNFEVKILPTVPYYDLKENNFNFIVEARYVYGEKVSGVVYLRFGITEENGKRTFLRGMEKQVKLEEGKVNVDLSTRNLSATLMQPLKDLKGHHLYIAATVVELATGDLEEQELSTVKFVTSPYVVDLSKTKRYFVPGVPFMVVVTVTHIDGSPATKIPTRMSMTVTGGSSPEPQSYTTDENGVATFYVNLPGSASSLVIEVTVEAGDSPEVSRTIVTRYVSKSGSYLNINVPYKVVQPDEPLSIDLKDITTPNTQITYFYYMVLNKGQILSLQRIQRSEQTRVELPITKKMIPAFRFVAYYYLADEIVANSIWVDVVDSCQGKLLVSTEQNELHPGSQLKLRIETDDEASVSLAAVDSAVYILNKKNRLTPNKMFQAMNSYDLGCSVGGGKDFQSVFQDAGLAFDSGTISSAIRKGYGCESEPRRRKRSLDFYKLSQEKANEYNDTTQQRCCRDGMALLPRSMKRTCEMRASRIRSDICRNIFLHCCTYASNLRKKHTPIRGLGRVFAGDEDEDFIDEGSIQSRSWFPESWMWRTVTIKEKLNHIEYVPDSITTWEIQAVSMSRERGICIIEPMKVKVFTPFHIYLRLPYSVKRFEQLEIRPVLYNYFDYDITVKVHMEKTEGICSPATATGPKIQSVLVPATSAVPVPFSIVPMGNQDLPVTVEARGPMGIGDRITKVLHIVREGISKLEEKTYQLDSANLQGRSTLHIPEEIPSNLIPDAHFSMSVRISTDSALETVNNSLAADGVSRLIRVPTGCAEQTMIYMAPSVYAMKYLDETEQWINLNPDRRKEALQNMESGYARILTFQKPDGSYGAWTHTPSSTWLTAFVAKVLSICRDHISVDDDHIRKAVTFLLSKQKANGEFYDPHPVYHREMQGGVGGLEGDVTLTAFVTIALHHTLSVHKEDSSALRQSIKNATAFLQQRLLRLFRPYAVAISAYALTLASDVPAAKNEAHSVLMNYAKEIQDLNMLFWEAESKLRLEQENKKNLVPSASAISVEATSYALMHMLLRNDITKTNKIVGWLTEQQNYGGGFKSTQDTVVALEALSQYWIRSFTNEAVNLKVTIVSPRRQAEKKILLERSTNQIHEELQFGFGDSLNVDLEGHGRGTLTIMKLYRVLQVENNTCQHLKLEVDVSGEVKYTEEIENDYNYDYGDEPADEPLPRIQWYDLRRQRRSTSKLEKTKEKSVSYTVCLSCDTQVKLSGMAIADISMLSGFQPSFEDLNRLKDLSDRYINHFEYQYGRLLLYFDKVPVERDCISFEAIQKVPIGLLQPASATLYDFYDPDQKCTVSYSAPSKSKLVSALCSEEVCQCAEGPCPYKKKTREVTGKDTDPRLHHACYSPRVKYGYKVVVKASAEKDAFVVYEGRISAVLQYTKDEKVTKGAIRYFIKRKACKMDLEIGKEYLIMGKDGDTYDPSGNLQYLLESTSWVEELLNEVQCKSTRYRNVCSQANDFMDSYQKNGCMV